MKHRTLIAAIVAVALGTITLAFVPGPAAVDAQTSAPCRPAGGPETPNPQLSVTATVDQPAYPPGAAVTFTLTVTNPTNEPVTVGVGEPFADFAVRSAAGDAEVWRWSYGKFFLAILRLCGLGPGESVSVSEVWDQRDNQGQQVPAGEYVLIAELDTPQPRPTAAPVPFSIGEAAASVTVDRGPESVYAIGDLILVCYAVPAAGSVTLIDILADGTSQVLRSETNDGSGGCLLGIVTPPTGRECLRLEFATAVGTGSTEVCFQVTD